MDWTQLAGPIATLTVCAGGGLIAYGKFKASAVTKDECKLNQEGCQAKLHHQLEELKNLTVSLHKEVQTNIKDIDSNHDDFKGTFNKEIKDIAMAIGRIEGRLNGGG